MSKIEKLTPQQEAQLSIHKNKWLDKIFNQKSKKINKQKMIEANNWLYEFSGLKPPITIVVDSPFACQVAANILSRNQVRNQVGDQVWDQVGDQVGGQVGNQVWDQVWDQVGDQVGGQVWGQVRDQVGDQVRNQVMDQVMDQVWGQVGDQVRDQVRDQVVDQVGGLDYFSFSDYGNYSDFGWLSFYSYFLNNFDFYTKSQKENLQKMIDYINIGVFMSIQLRGFCIVCPVPILMKRNNANDLHCEDGYACQFSDGYGFYALDGVRFRPKHEKLYWKIVNHELTLPEILAIEDIDVRAISLKYCNAQQIIDDLGDNAELLDEATKEAEYLERKAVSIINGVATINFDKKVKKVLSYKLYKITIKHIFDQPEYMIVYPHASLDGLSYWKGVHPDIAKDGALASIANNHNMTTEEYLSATSQS
jgi:hypothetical protein